MYNKIDPIQIFYDDSCEDYTNILFQESINNFNSILFNSYFSNKKNLTCD